MKRFSRSRVEPNETVADVAAGLGVAENMLHAWKYVSAAEEVRRVQFAQVWMPILQRPLK